MWFATGWRTRRRHRSDRKGRKDMKWGNQSAMRTAAVGALLLSAVAALTFSPLLPVGAAELDRELARQLSRDSDNEPASASAIVSVKSRFLSLGVGKSVV